MSYRAIIADPPWQYKDKLRMDDVDRSSEDHYDTMSIADVMGLTTSISMHPGRVHRIAGFDIADDAILFLWITNSFLLTGDGCRVARAWGFEPKQLITWVKTKKDWADTCEELTSTRDLLDCWTGAKTTGEVSAILNEKALQFGMGHYTRGVTEHIILATKGKCTKLVKAKNIRNVIFAPRRKHSQKPDEQYALVESLLDGPYLELFARNRREGWTAWGDGL